MFISMKLGSNELTPFLFVSIVIFCNWLGHTLLLLWGKYKQKKNINFNLPKQTLYVAILIGFIITTNDLTSIYMFKTGADLSISMPIFTAGNVFLTIIFGLLVMKEKINIKQFCGLISIVGGIILLNV